jgi:hypothetical protein
MENIEKGQFLESSYKLSQIFNKTIIEAQKEFLDLSLEEMVKKYHSKKKSLEFESRLRFEFAIYYAITKKYFDNQDLTPARTQIQSVINTNPFIKKIDEMLIPLEERYLEICMEKKEFLTLEKLDKVIFEKYIKNTPFSPDIYKKFGLALYKGNPLEIIGLAYYTINQTKVESDKGSSHSSLKLTLKDPLIIEIKFANMGPIETFTGCFGENFNKYSIIEVNDHNAMPYILSRFFIESVGRTIYENNALNNSSENRVKIHIISDPSTLSPINPRRF